LSRESFALSNKNKNQHNMKMFKNINWGYIIIGLVVTVVATIVAQMMVEEKRELSDDGSAEVATRHFKNPLKKAS